MPVVMMACEHKLINNHWHKENKPSENNVWLKGKHITIEIEIVAAKRVVASENNRDK